MFTTLRQVKSVFASHDLRLVGHYVDRKLYYTVLNFRGGVCFGGLNQRADKRAIIDFANRYYKHLLATGRG